MTFLVERELDHAIRACMASPDARCAVAFLGRGAGAVFGIGVQVRIVCNLLAGGTNPHEIKSLLKAGHDLKQNDHLHAKVYVGGNKAVVASANLSANGLGLEADELANWIEAGAVIDEAKPISAWFERLWINPETRTITPQDIEDALTKWRNRRFGKPTLRSFAQFDPAASDFPLLYSFSDDDYEVNRRAVKDQLGVIGDQADTIIDNSLVVHDEADMPLMEPGRWILWWRVTQTSMPHKSAVLEWGKIGKRLSKVWRHDKRKGKWQDCILTDCDARPVPFNCTDKSFNRMFKEVLSEKEFSDLRELDVKGAYFVPRMKLMQAFWTKLKTRYVSKNLNVSVSR